MAREVVAIFASRQHEEYPALSKCQYAWRQFFGNSEYLLENVGQCQDHVWELRFEFALVQRSPEFWRYARPILLYENSTG